jgi:2-polyprenyl-3-methyl-5-hydroxy-6-metoxy-1,4-benzoquinol methylase
MFNLDNWQKTLIVILLLLIVNYVIVKYILRTDVISDIDDTNEAFNSVREHFSGGNEVDSVREEFTNENLYDSFYVKIYDQVVHGESRIKSEVMFTLSWIKKIQPDVASLEILDIGCGTGGHVDEFKKEGCVSVKGIDRSGAMIERAKKLYPANNYLLGDVESTTLFSAGQFNLVTMYYFTMYYLPHREQILKNIFTWMKPGGGLVIHIVNREKFDPILEAASPFSGFSLQKYSKSRVTKSTISFDKFQYTAEFSNADNQAQFEETFKFKDGRVRKNLHVLHMPIMEQLVSEIEAAGFIYKEFIDMTPIGYEYQYLFCFVR